MHDFLIGFCVVVWSVSSLEFVQLHYIFVDFLETLVLHLHVLAGHL